MMGTHLDDEDRQAYAWYRSRGIWLPLEDRCRPEDDWGVPEPPALWMRPLLSVLGYPLVETGKWVVEQYGEISRRDMFAEESLTVVPWSALIFELNKMEVKTDPAEWTGLILERKVAMMRSFVMGGNHFKTDEEAAELAVSWMTAPFELSLYRLCVLECPERGFEIGGLEAGREWLAERDAQLAEALLPPIITQNGAIVVKSRKKDPSPANLSMAV